MNSNPDNSDREKQNVPRQLSTHQRDVLVGCLLGDAHLEWSVKKLTARIKFEQSAKHQDYLWHLYEVFKSFVLVPPKRRIHSSEKECVSIRFQTVRHSCFRFFGHQFTANERKTVPQLIHRWINPRSFAYWFMDDGSIKSKQSKGVLLNTHCFNLAEIQLLIEAIETKLLLKATVRRQRDGNQIYISGESYERLVEILDPWVIGSMRYKIPPPRRT